MELMISLITTYGIWIIAIGCFFQSTLMVLVTGMLVYENVISLPYAVLITVSSAWAGHLFWYFLGVSLNEKCKVLFKSQIAIKLEKVNQIIRRNPWISIFLLQYLYSLKLIGAISFGMAKLPKRWFALAQFVNCTIWTLAMGTIGGFFSQYIHISQWRAIKMLWISLSLVIIYFTARWFHLKKIKENQRLSTSNINP
ncbi:VTT domain-containing protein [bacterium]|nr:VTT domain-containing protein [candidate division CSSED10-310 bacterium]